MPERLERLDRVKPLERVQPFDHAGPRCLMGVRRFRDDTGVEWTVWDTRPSQARLVQQDFKAGWLTFESLRSRRRLALLPKGWEAWSDERLCALLGAASEVARVPVEAADRQLDDQAGA